MNIKIESFDKLPDLATRRWWANELKVHEITLVRANKSGKLTVAAPNSRNILITKSAILKWLGVE
jgi:hypothetical protein